MTVIKSYVVRITAASSDGGLSTVVTDGETIQGDGSVSSPVAVIPGVFEAAGSAAAAQSAAIAASEAYTDAAVSEFSNDASTYTITLADNTTDGLGITRADNPSCLVRADGVLILVCPLFQTLNVSDSGLSNLYTKRSTDGGLTWTAWVQCFPTIGTTGTYNPSLFQRTDLSVFMICLIQNTADTSELWKVESNDQGVTWTGTQTKIYGVASKYYAPAPDRIYKTSTGRLLYPFNENTSPGNLGSQTGTYIGRMLYSDNDGVTWSLSVGTYSSPDNFVGEPGVIPQIPAYQAEAPALTIYFRTRSGYSYATRSTDDGSTFAAVAFSTGLRSQNSMVTIIYHKPQEVYFGVVCKYDSANGYKNYLILYSSKDARTWNYTQVIDYSLVNTVIVQEPVIYMVGDVVKVMYMKSNSAVTQLNLYQKSIPLSFISQIGVEQYDSVKIKRGFGVGAGSYLAMFNDNTAEASGYAKFDPIGGTSTAFGLWSKFRCTAGTGWAWLCSLVQPTAGNQGMEIDLSTNESTGALTGGLFRVRNGGFNGSGGTLPMELHATYLKTIVPRIIDADISPAQIVANTNDYAPTGINTAATLRLSTDASRDITGIAGGATMVDGREITIFNVGAQNIVLKNDVTSTAANRFLLGADVTITPEQGVRLVYDATSARWRKLF